MTTTTLKPHTNRRIMLQGCPRCHGDLLHDIQDEEFVCIQCSRRFSAERLAQEQPVLAAAA